MHTRVNDFRFRIFNYVNKQNNHDSEGYRIISASVNLIY
jgi:hypothetical protein